MLPRFKTCGKRVKNKVSSTANCLFFTDLLTRALSGYLVAVFSEPSWLSFFGADSLSRSVHCAPDENEADLLSRLKFLN